MLKDFEILFKPLPLWSNTPVTDCAAEIAYNDKTWRIADEEDLARARKEIQIEVNLDFMRRGVDILDIESSYIHPDTVIGENTVIFPHVVIREDVIIGSGCSIGPFAHVRPGSRISDNCIIGDFVEIKNTSIGERTAVSHLTYLGDACVGSGVNFGCGTVTANFDGKDKHKTIIGDRAFIGCNTNMIAPVTIGENAITAAGSTITKDVPPNALAIERNKQIVRENYRK